MTFEDYIAFMEDASNIGAVLYKTRETDVCKYKLFSDGVVVKEYMTLASRQQEVDQKQSDLDTVATSFNAEKDILAALDVELQEKKRIRDEEEAERIAASMPPEPEVPMEVNP